MEPSGACLQEALTEAPNYGPGHQWYAVCLVSRGRFDEAIGEIRRARDVEPQSLIINAVQAWILYFARRYDAAIAAANATLEMDSGFATAHSYLGLTYTVTGRFDEAEVEFRRSMSNSGPGARTGYLGRLGFVLARQRRTDDARAVIAELEPVTRDRYVSPYATALVHLGLGERDRALELLGRATDEHYPWVIHFNIDPVLDELRADLRFKALIARIGLPEVALPSPK